MHFRRSIGAFGLFLLLLALLAYYSWQEIQRPKLQSYLIKQVSTYLSEKLNSNIQIDSIFLDYPNNLFLKNVYISDLECDTLLYFQEASIDFADLDVFQKKVNIEKVTLIKPYFNLKRKAKEDAFNLNHVITEVKDTVESNRVEFEQRFGDLVDLIERFKPESDGKPWAVELQLVNLQQARFDLTDDKKQEYVQAEIEEVLADIDHINIEQNFVQTKLYAERPDVHYQRKTKQLKVDVLLSEIEADLDQFNWKKLLIEGVAKAPEADIQVIEKRKGLTVNVDLKDLAMDLEELDLHNLLAQGQLQARQTDVHFVQPPKDLDLTINAQQLNADLAHFDIHNILLEGKATADKADIHLYKPNQDLTADISLYQANTNLPKLDITNLLAKGQLQTVKGKVKVYQAPKDLTVTIDLQDFYTNLGHFDIDKLLLEGKVKTGQTIVSVQRPQHLAVAANITQLEGDLTQADIRNLFLEGIVNAQQAAIQVQQLPKQLDIDISLNNFKSNLQQLDLTNFLAQGQLQTGKGAIAVKQGDKDLDVAVELDNFETQLAHLDFRELLIDGMANAQNAQLAFAQPSKNLNIELTINQFNTKLQQPIQPNLLLVDELSNGQLQAAKLKGHWEQPEKTIALDFDISNIDTDLTAFDLQQLIFQGKTNAQTADIHFTQISEGIDLTASTKNLITDIVDLDLKKEQHFKGDVQTQEIDVQFQRANQNTTATVQIASFDAMVEELFFGKGKEFFKGNVDLQQADVQFEQADRTLTVAADVAALNAAINEFYFQADKKLLKGDIETQQADVILKQADKTIDLQANTAAFTTNIEELNFTKDQEFFKGNVYTKQADVQFKQANKTIDLAVVVKELKGDADKLIFAKNKETFKGKIDAQQANIQFKQADKTIDLGVIIKDFKGEADELVFAKDKEFFKGNIDAQQADVQFKQADKTIDLAVVINELKGNADKLIFAKNKEFFKGIIDAQQADVQFKQANQTIDLELIVDDLAAAADALYFANDRRSFQGNIEATQLNGLFKQDNKTIDVATNLNNFNAEVEQLHFLADKQLFEGKIQTQKSDVHFLRPSKDLEVLVTLNELDGHIKQFNWIEKLAKGKLHFQQPFVDFKQPEKTLKLTATAQQLTANVSDFDLDKIILDGKAEAKKLETFFQQTNKDILVESTVNQLITDNLHIDLDNKKAVGQLLTKKADVYWEKPQKKTHLNGSIAHLKSNIEELDFGKMLLQGDLVAQRTDVQFVNKTTAKTITVNVAELQTDVPKLNFKKVIAEGKLNVKKSHFTLTDSLSNSTIDAKVKKLATQLKRLDLPQQKILLKNANITQPIVQIKQGYKADAPQVEDPNYFQKVVPINNFGWLFRTKAFDLTDGSFALQHFKAAADTTNVINFKNLKISDIQADFDDFYYGKDRLTAAIKHLSAKEKSGFELEKLAAQVKFTPKQLSFSDLLLKTPNSNLGKYLSFNYHSLRDFTDFTKRVTLEADFKKDAFFVFSDINYFTKPLLKVAYIQKQKDKKIHISGKVKDKISNFKGDAIAIKIDNSEFQGDFKLKGLPNFQSTNIDFNVNLLNTTVDEITDFLPKKIKLPANFDKLGKIDFKGSFQGFPKSFVAHGEIKTAMGTVTSDLHMDMTDSTETIYAGDLAAIDFDLGGWIGKPDLLGKISFNTRVEGSGLKLEELDALVDGTVESITFREYTYQNIEVIGSIIQKSFDGDFTITDENVDLALKGKIDLNDSIPKFAFDQLNIKKAHLQNIKLLKRSQVHKDLIVSGVGSLNIVGLDPDTFEGEANFETLTVKHGTKRLTFDQSSVRSDFKNRLRKLNLRTPAVDADFHGTFNFKELANATQNYLNTYFPYRFKYTQPTTPQDIRFSVRLKDPVPVATFFEPKLTALQLRTGTIVGNLNTSTKHMELDIKIPSVYYDGIQIDTITLAADSDLHQINFATQTQHINARGTSLPLVNVSGEVFNDSIQFDIKAATDTASNHLQLTGLLFANVDTLKMNFSKVELKLNNQEWEAKTGIFTYKNKNDFKIDEFTLKQASRSISVTSQPHPNYKNATYVQVENIVIEDFKEQVKAVRNMDMKGTINGDVIIRDLFGQQIINAAATIDNYQIRGASLGSINVEADKKKEDNYITVSANVNTEPYFINLEGIYQLPDTTKADDKGQLALKTTQNIRFPLAFFDIFVGKFTSDLGGLATGQLNISGSPTAPTLDGNFWITDGGLTIDYLNTPYTFHNQKVVIENSVVKVINASLNDKYDNTAKIDHAYLYLNDFKNISVDAKVTSDNFLFMETDMNDNEVFYGTAFGDGLATFKGPISDLEMYVNGKSNKGTKIYIPISYQNEIEKDKFYEFIQKGPINKKVVAKKDTTNLSGLKVKLDLDVTNDAELQIIFDLQAGDIIRSVGHGDIQVLVNTKAGEFDFDVYGQYTLDSGDYLFTLQNLVNKRFNIKQGGTVSFAGDPYNALLDVSAIYNLKASRLDLLSEEEQEALLRNESTELRRRVPVNVFLNMAGSLSQPNIDFNIIFPDQTNTRLDNVISAKISDVTENNKNELDKQIFGLLVLNKFIPEQTLNISNIRTGVNTTVSELLSSYLSNYLGEAISDIIPDSDLNVNWRNYTTDQVSGEGQARNEIELVFTKRLFDNRLSIDIGGQFDVGNEVDGQTNSNVAVASDVLIQYNITEDGRLRLKAFNQYDRDVFTGDYNKTGVSFFLTREFDSFKDLFKKRKKQKGKKKKDEQENDE